MWTGWTDLDASICVVALTRLWRIFFSEGSRRQRQLRLRDYILRRLTPYVSVKVQLSLAISLDTHIHGRLPAHSLILACSERRTWAFGCHFLSVLTPVPRLHKFASA